SQQYLFAAVGGFMPLAVRRQAVCPAVGFLRLVEVNSLAVCQRPDPLCLELPKPDERLTVPREFEVVTHRVVANFRQSRPARVRGQHANRSVGVRDRHSPGVRTDGIELPDALARIEKTPHDRSSAPIANADVICRDEKVVALVSESQLRNGPEVAGRDGQWL